jgi:Tfp pilus assembly protein PilZ
VIRRAAGRAVPSEIDTWTTSTTMDEHESLDRLSLPQLVTRLRDLHTQKTPLGWPTESAVTKSSVERRIFELVARERSREGRDDPAERIRCDIAVKLRGGANRKWVRSSTVDLRIGGLFVAFDAPFAVGEPIDLEIETDNNYRLRVQGNVGWASHARADQPAGVGVVFLSVVGDSAERRLHRLFIELLRNRLET